MSPQQQRPLASIRVRTTDYEFSHGKRPSGRGYWAFQIGDDPEPWWPTTTEAMLARGDTSISYSEAKQLALKEAQRQGAWSISILP